MDEQGAWNRYGEKGTWYYEVEEPGYKMNMFDVQASLGLVQLSRLDDMQARREQIAKAYNQAFQKEAGLILPPVHHEGRHAWHLYVLQVDPKEAFITRDELIDQLQKEYKIGTSVHFILFICIHTINKPITIHQRFPKSLAYYKRTLSLPLYPSMTDEDVQDVITACCLF
ncbi:DegT/DnrJ/EryC1/StrS family aminotransferase [Bacillus pumilus]|nr:DegT/DnrJ/EryC1/StrS family aminotransferase [Bacillus pumilus]